MSEKKIKIGIKFFIGIILLGILVFKLYNNKIEFFNYTFNNYYFFLGFILILFSFFIITLRIHILVSDHVEGYIETLKMFVIGWFFSNILPTNIGGDGYMILHLKKKSVSMTKAVTLVTFQRFIGLMVLIVFGIGYLVFYPNWIYKIDLNLNISFNFVIFASLIFIILLCIFFILFKGVIKKQLKKARKFFMDYKSILNDFKFSKHLNLILLSISYHLIRLAGLSFFLLSFNQKVDPPDILFIMVIVTIGSLIPISIGALGVQESLFTLGLSTFGVSVPIAIIVSFMNRGIFILVALIGGVLFLFDKKKKST